MINSTRLASLTNKAACLKQINLYTRITGDTSMSKDNKRLANEFRSFIYDKERQF